MNNFAGQSMFIQYSCGHYGWFFLNDLIHSTCPACYPPLGQNSWPLKRRTWISSENDLRDIAPE